MRRVDVSGHASQSCWLSRPGLLDLYTHLGKIHCVFRNNDRDTYPHCVTGACYQGCICWLLLELSVEQGRFGGVRGHGTRFRLCIHLRWQVSACSQTACVRTSYARTATVTPITATEAQDPAQETLKLRTSSLFIPIQDSLKQQKIAPFSIENSRRRRFML